MKKFAIACAVSSVLGGWLSVGDISPLPSQQVEAQEFLNQTPPTRGPVGLPTTLDAQDLAEFTPDERVNILVYEHTNRSVVHITTKVSTPETFFSVEGASEGAGSGSILDKNGHVLTNYHVIEDATQIRVTLFNGETYDAGLVGRDPLTDIAVLRITAPAESLIPIELGDSARLRVGQKVLAIGNPFGLERTLTVGTVSSLNRRLPAQSGERQLKSMIQIDAALNRGNSGGPSLNTQGKMIGMNTAILSPTGQNIGVGFALPVNTIRRVVPQLIENGRVIRPVIGIASVWETDQGLVIIEVSPGGPAERAGLRGFRLVRKREKRGPFYVERSFIDRTNADTILAVDDRQVANGDALQELIESKRPGDQLVLRILRSGQTLDVPVTLGASE